MEADALLAQREKDLNSFLQRKQQMDTLIKMMSKVKENITGEFYLHSTFPVVLCCGLCVVSFSGLVLVHPVPEMSTLEEQHSADLQTTSLSKLVMVQSFDADGKLKAMGSPQVRWYNTGMNALKMSREMHQLHQSNLILSSWVKTAASVASASVASAMQPSSSSIALTLTQVCENIWTPIVEEFFQLGVSIANAEITIQELDQVLEKCGDHGDGRLMEQELKLMAAMFSESQRFKPEKNWVELRLKQIKEYSQLMEVAAAASAVLKIAEKMQLSGDFRQIETLSQVVTVLH